MKTAWITGASRGIGKATAERFLQENWRVVILTRNTQSLQPLTATFPDQLHLIPTDLNALDPAMLPSFPVDVLINNAGTLINKPMASMTRADLEWTYSVNVFGPYLLIQSLLGQFSPDAHIINISSVGGVQGSVKFPGLTAYSSSKGALNVLTECLQAEFEQNSWTFNALALGAVQTEMLQQAFPDFQAEVSPAQMADYIFGFATTAHRVLRGKVISVSRSTP